MKTEKNILVAFILNMSFSIFEFVGGVLTGSIAIISDAIHDMGDAISIGASYFLEKKSKKQPDDVYTYGYARYSVIGGALTTLILLLGSVVVIYQAVERILKPTEINYDGMIIFAIVGVGVNLCAAILTREGDSLNQKAVNLHMLEDVLGWMVVLIGAIVMKFTDFALLDPIMSIGVAGFILTNAVRNLREIMDVFLEKVPDNISIEELKEHVSRIDGVVDVHHIHVWSLDGYHHCATMHVVSNQEFHKVKANVREELEEHGIFHVTIEVEKEGEECHIKHCQMECKTSLSHHHHHHHHH